MPRIMSIPEDELAETLIVLTSDIAVAHVSNNAVPLDQIPTLIEKIYGALAGLGGSTQAEEAPREPAVSI